MEGCMFFNTEFKPVEVPIFHSVDEYDHFMMNVDYIYFDTLDSLKAFNNIRNGFENGETPFTNIGAYEWDSICECWVNLQEVYIKSRATINMIGNVYTLHTTLPLTYKSEVAD